MIIEIIAKDYFEKLQDIPLIDVRSPGEHSKGHIPNAINIALFTDPERAAVGTCYVQKSKEKAIELGLKFVQPKLTWFIDESKKASSNLEVAVHCWRGGMRSHSFAEHLISNGFKKVYLIVGGYKAYRNHVLSFFEQDFNLNILGGYTGSGKTHILKCLMDMGEQTIDLEGLAHHKGSAFGAIGEKNQPTVEQFENDLHDKLRFLQSDAPIWVEDESHKIGYVGIPMAFYKQMRSQQVFFIDIPREKRAEHLVIEYSTYGNSLIKDAVLKIAKRLGGLNIKMALDLLDQNNYFEVALIALKYYDKAYTKGVQDRNQDMVKNIPLPDVNFDENAKSILSIAKNNG